MLQSRKFLVAFAVVAVALMVSETATAQIFNGRLRGLFGGRNNACCEAPAPAPCCGATAPALVGTPVQGAVMQSAPLMQAAPTASCCGGGTPMNGTVIEGSSAPSVMEGGTIMDSGMIINGANTGVVEGAFIQGSVLEGSYVDQGVVEGSVIETPVVQSSPSDVVESTNTSNTSVIDAAQQAVETVTDIVEPPVVTDGN